jgi:hypothetical protein
VSDWAEMAKKTAFRRLSKWLPLSAEVRDVIDRDDDVIDAPERTRKPITELAAFSFVSDEPDEHPTARAIDAHNADETRSDTKAGLNLDAFRASLAECKVGAQVGLCFAAWNEQCATDDERATVQRECDKKADELRSKSGGKQKELPT